MLESPYGARTDARTREHFDRLIDRINAYEVTALAQGDGFAETKYEPASIDEVLKIATFPRPEAAPQTTEAVKQDLAATAHDIPIPQNSRVLSYVELDVPGAPPGVRSGRPDPRPEVPADDPERLPRGRVCRWIWPTSRSSRAGSRPTRVSKASAKGPWQFMKPTGKENGLRHDWYVDERSDPEKSTIAAAKYLKTLHKLFKGDWNLVLAAYNGGLGRVQRAMKKSGHDDFWELSESSRFLPKETREYVPLILAAIIVAKNPAQYGFDIVAHDPIAYDKVTLPARHRPAPGRGVDRRVDRRDSGAEPGAPAVDDARQVQGVRAQGAGRDGRQASGEHRRRLTSRFERVEVVHGPRRRVAGDDRAQAPGQPRRPGGGEQPVGQVARPRRPGADHSARSGDTARRSHRTGRAGRSRLARAQRIGHHVGPVDPDAERDRLPVKRGDTLSSIARLFDTTVTRIKALNKLRGNALAVGARLKIDR